MQGFGDISSLASRPDDPVERHRQARLARVSENAAPSLGGVSRRDDGVDLARFFGDFDEQANANDNSLPQAAMMLGSSRQAAGSGKANAQPLSFRPIIGFGLAGLAVGLAIAFATPQRFVSQAEVLLDPAEFTLPGGAAASEYVARETALAIVDSKLGIARSAAVLGKVVERAKLDRDPEFNGEGGPLQSVFAFVSLFSSADSIEARDRVALRKLRESLTAERAPRGLAIDISVASTSSAKSTLLTGEVAQAFIEELAKGVPGGVKPTTGARLGMPAEPLGLESTTSGALAVSVSTAAGLALGALLVAFGALSRIASGRRSEPRVFAQKPAPRRYAEANDVAEAVRVARQAAPASVSVAAAEPETPAPSSIAGFAPSYTIRHVATGYAWPPSASVTSELDEIELDELRRSVREMRATIEALVRKRSERRRKVA